MRNAGLEEAEAGIQIVGRKIDKQDVNIQLSRTPFPIWNQSVVPCQVLIVAS